MVLNVFGVWFQCNMKWNNGFFLLIWSVGYKLRLYINKKKIEKIISLIINKVLIFGQFIFNIVLIKCKLRVLKYFRMEFWGLIFEF